MKIKLLRPVKYQWVAPLLSLFAAAINLFNPRLSNTLTMLWLCLLPILVVGLVIGVINHKKFLDAKLEDS